MEIPDNTVGWLIGAFGAIAAWLVRLEARLSSRPTRREQEAIAAKVAMEVHAQFQEIKQMLEKQNEQSSLHRELMGASIAEIRTKVAVLRARAGDDPSGETGSFRRWNDR